MLPCQLIVDSLILSYFNMPLDVGNSILNISGVLVVFLLQKMDLSNRGKVKMH